MSFASSTRNAGNRLSKSVGRGTHRLRKPMFYLVTVAFVAFLVFALRETMAMAITAWGAGYAFPDHRVHHMLIGGTLTVFAATVAVQLYRPLKRIGALQAALAFVLMAFVITLLASGVAAVSEILVFVIPVLLIALLHPAGRGIVPTLKGMDSRLLALAGVGALGFGAIGVREFLSQTTLSDAHVLMGHYEFAAIAAGTIGLFAILAALRPVGWRTLAYAAAALALLFAAGSLAFPGAEQGSSLGTIASLAVILWAVGFVALAEYVDRTEETPTERSETATAS